MRDKHYHEKIISKTEIQPKNILSLHERGILEDIFPPASVSLPDELRKKQTFYCGFDPTADSLHVGNLLSLMVMLHCQRAGTYIQNLFHKLPREAAEQLCGVN